MKAPSPTLLVFVALLGLAGACMYSLPMPPSDCSTPPLPHPFVAFPLLAIYFFAGHPAVIRGTKKTAAMLLLGTAVLLTGFFGLQLMTMPMIYQTDCARERMG
jgi:hypothetical protein